MVAVDLIAADAPAQGVRSGHQPFGLNASDTDTAFWSG